mmetsp:Transcript_17638/g.58094  ORF Transcript_17638/g.58094 Transcript_17638/m.58094 type:complete len:438 (-) Transcript_17638:125-1438(-)
MNSSSSNVSRQDMLMVKRLQKSALRDETKELIDKLDKLVPAKRTIRRHRSLLKSGRSITQLLSDVLQKITCLNSPTGPTNQTEPQNSHDYDRMYREIFTRALELMLLVDVGSRKVVSMSKGFQKLSEHSRALKGFHLGQHIRFLVHPKCLTWDACKSEEQSRAEGCFRDVVNFLAIRDHSATFYPCVLESKILVSDGRFMLLFFNKIDPRPIGDIFDSLIPSAVKFDWTVFSFDSISSTCFPCDVERILRKSDPGYVEGSFMLAQMCNIWEETSFNAELSNIARLHQISLDLLKALSLQTAVKVSWEGELPCCTVLFRFKVPSLYGIFETQWLQETKIVVDGKPVRTKGYESLFHLQADWEGDGNNALQLVELKTAEVCDFALCLGSHGRHFRDCQPSFQCELLPPPQLLVLTDSQPRSTLTRLFFRVSSCNLSCNL